MLHRVDGHANLMAAYYFVRRPAAGGLTTFTLFGSFKTLRFSNQSSISKPSINWLATIAAASSFSRSVTSGVTRLRLVRSGAMPELFARRLTGPVSYMGKGQGGQRYPGQPRPGSSKNAKFGRHVPFETKNFGFCLIPVGRLRGRREPRLIPMGASAA
jgi:hypothetical protein